MTRLLTIALILVATAGQAQNDTITLEEDWFVPDGFHQSAYIDPPSASIDLVSDWLLPLLNEYAETCWNDSTEVQVISGYWSDWRNRQETIWVHTEPTFSGFIKWLNKWKK